EMDEYALQRYRPTAQQQVRQALEALGYYRSTIEISVLTGKKPGLQVEVQPGAPVRLRQVDVQVTPPASQLRAFAELDLDELQVGQILDHGAYENLKSYLQQNALRYGFFAATFERQLLQIDPDALAADIQLHFDSGPRYLFGEVELPDDSFIRHDLMRRLIPFSAGDPYDSALLARFNQNLQATGYFEDIRIDADPAAHQELQVPVR